MAVDDVTSLLDQAGVPRTNFTDLAKAVYASRDADPRTAQAESSAVS